VTISCEKTEKNIKIAVIDDGEGIGDQDLPHLFERFYKGQGGNMGIGLSIVKSIADQHRGTLKAENITDGGAMFTMIFPI
jgi:signal transduction histidine kinase